ncbi:enolase C-terminal domain-like protein [Pseudaestuariivita atlantica]|uniref:enolase C-terminal domain-like protein n=1 Tax=Pseudaestuariivita atlantica TaxID=1317121 RepID=UPI00067E58CA|nr:enolase C-terminal domain-like protein [Pseudaestuariivita atlantica]
MRIASLTLRACKQETSVAASSALRGVARSEGLEFLVYTLTTECGRSVSMFGFAGADAEGSARLAKSLEPFLVGRDARDREALWHDFRKQDRFWSLLPIYVWGPVDCCLWLLAAEAGGQPLWRFLGGCRDEVPVYVSSMFHTDGQTYVDEALAAQAQGFAAYKLHPPGNSIDEDLAIHAACREAVGPGFGLMSDPVAFMTYEQALRYGRRLEELDYIWFEEPMQDENIPALKALTASLDIPVVGTETLAKHPYSVAACIADRVVDVVRADVSWSGGVTSVLKTAHLAEAFGMNCEIHTAIFHPLEMVNLHLCGAVKNCSYLELLCPVERFDFGLTDALPVHDGVARLPDGPGLGRELDWDLIDNATLWSA